MSLGLGDLEFRVRSLEFGFGDLEFRVWGLGA